MVFILVTFLRFWLFNFITGHYFYLMLCTVNLGLLLQSSRTAKIQNELAHFSGNKLSPRGRRDDMSPPMAVRLAADLRPSADGSAVRTSLVAGHLQATSVRIARAAAPRSQRAYCLSAETDRRTDRLMPPVRLGA